MQFYPADWMKDPELQICSMNTIGIWINILCRMWEAKEEGILRGKPDELALLVGARPAEFKRFLVEAEKHQFCDVLQNVTKSYSAVTLKCRRMNSLFLERKRAKKGMQETRKGRLLQGCYAPSSSSPSSSSSNTSPIPPKGFEQFWKIYPRKAGKGKARDSFRKLSPDSDLLAKILAAVQQQSKSEQWQKDDGQFIPMPATWLNQERWDDELPERKKTRIQKLDEQYLETKRKEAQG